MSMFAGFSGGKKKKQKKSQAGRGGAGKPPLPLLASAPSKSIAEIGQRSPACILLPPRLLRWCSQGQWTPPGLLAHVPAGDGNQSKLHPRFKCCPLLGMGKEVIPPRDSCSIHVPTTGSPKTLRTPPPPQPLQAALSRGGGVTCAHPVTMLPQNKGKLQVPFLTFIFIYIYKKIKYI